MQGTGCSGQSDVSVRFADRPARQGWSAQPSQVLARHRRCAAFEVYFKRTRSLRDETHAARVH